jgi:hypothetical protein
MPGNDAFKRFFRKFGQADSHRVNKYFYRWMFDNLAFDNYTLDSDSIVMAIKREPVRVIIPTNPVAGLTIRLWHLWLT